MNDKIKLAEAVRTACLQAALRALPGPREQRDERACEGERAKEGRSNASV